MEVIRLLSSQHVFLASLTLLAYCNVTVTYKLKLAVSVFTFSISIFTEILLLMKILGMAEGLL